jgi:hypothetical protein
MAAVEGKADGLCKSLWPEQGHVFRVLRREARQLFSAAYYFFQGGVIEFIDGGIAGIFTE